LEAEVNLVASHSMAVLVAVGLLLCLALMGGFRRNAGKNSRIS